MSNDALRIIKSQKNLDFPLFESKDNIVWIEPKLVCTVKYMHKTEAGGMRQPVFKGLSEKMPQDCQF